MHVYACNCSCLATKVKLQWNFFFFWDQQFLSLIGRSSPFRGLNCIESTVWGKKSRPLCNCILTTESPFFRDSTVLSYTLSVDDPYDERGVMGKHVI